MLNNRCYILSSYFENPSVNFFEKIKDENIPIICADGGQTLADEYNLDITVTIGDFDSSFSSNMSNIVYPKEKNITDTEGCIIYAKEKGFNDITILGGLGGRADHSLGNLGLLAKYDVKLLNSFNHIIFISDQKVKIHRSIYTYLSVIPYGCNDIFISINGVKYPLYNHNLIFNETLGISNEIIDDFATIEIKGSALIIESKD
ncbi:MAG TPA: thiamine diphosphokinase [Anaerovoracaceae bacterium]|nr:thiamine diphosphokinase [Anaerovoracaceae bacterium]